MLRFRLLLTLIIAGSLTLPLQAATITVADNGADYTSIQAAINAANNGNKILVSPGTYVENIDFNGKAITLRSASGDPADTIIDAGGSGSVVTCDSGETSTTVLDGFTITNGSASYGGGMYNESSSPTVSNCILWGDSPDEIYNTNSSTPTVSYSDLQGGLPSYTIDDGGNIAVDPLFVDADGPDNTAGTEDDKLRLSGGSPCIDAGSGFLASAFPFDLDGNQRVVDDPATTDTGVGFPEVVDMGAYEFGSSPALCISQLEGDINCDGIVNLLDQALLALHWLETI